jgi:hypothetical protein
MKKYLLLTLAVVATTGLAPSITKAQESFGVYVEPGYYEGAYYPGYDYGPDEYYYYHRRYYYYPSYYYYYQPNYYHRWYRWRHRDHWRAND